MDVGEMQHNVTSAIASLMGIPFEIIGGGYSAKEGGKKSLENSRVFVANMQNVCRHIENLLFDVYSRTFPDFKKEISFRLKSSPRIEISNVQVSYFGFLLIRLEKNRSKHSS